MGCPEQHCLRFEWNAPLAAIQNFLGHIASLIGFVADADQLRPLCRCTLGPKVLGESFVGQINDCIGRSEDRLR
jgi:hypothetical protein